MTTVPPPLALTDGDHLVLDDISWDFYEAMLREVGDRPIRIAYDRGSLEITLPTLEHEHPKKIIGGMIGMVSLERGIPIASLGSTTFRIKSKRVGLDPDECYYIQHEREIRGKKRIDLKRDPPPDLAVEVDITSRSIEREPIYAALGVPELWRFDGVRLRCLRLDSEGQYHATAKSLAFPFLRISDLDPFLKMIGTTDDTSVMRAFRDWVRRGLR
jgi:Uma2 family endonuclease